MMGGMLTQPITEKGSQQGEGLGLKYGLSSMQGWRPEMEDTHDVKLGLKYGLDDWSFFAVFDGHAGKCAAAYAAWNLLDHILKDSKFELGVDDWPETRDENPPKTSQDSSDLSVDHDDENTSKAPGTDNKLDEKTSDDNNSSEQDKTSNKVPLSTNPPSKSTETKDNKHQLEVSKFASFPVLQQLDMVKNAIRSGFLSIDQKMRIASTDMSGCTAVCTLISPTHLFIANCGDSRAVLYDGHLRLPKFATEDHKPFHPIERKRIIEAGGTATQRINGTLAVSRALGDFEFKKDELRGPCEQLVSPEPEVTVIERDPTDEFLILACDGIWDVMNNMDLCRFVRYKLKIESSLEKVCSSVLDLCLRKGSRDNMSIIIVVFENGPTVSQEEIKRDEKNDKLLLDYVEHIEDSVNLEEFSGLLDHLRNEKPNLSDILPPGGGVEAKYDLLHEYYEKNHKDEETLTAQE